MAQPWRTKGRERWDRAVSLWSPPRNYSVPGLSRRTPTLHSHAKVTNAHRGPAQLNTDVRHVSWATACWGGEAGKKRELHFCGLQPVSSLLPRSSKAFSTLLSRPQVSSWSLGW